jgi:hypothetical protein
VSPEFGAVIPGTTYQNGSPLAGFIPFGAFGSSVQSFGPGSGAASTGAPQPFLIPAWFMFLPIPR